MTVPKKPTIYYSLREPFLCCFFIVCFCFLSSCCSAPFRRFDLDAFSLHFIFILISILSLSKLTAVRSTAAPTTSTLALFRAPVLYYRRLIDFRYSIALCVLVVRHHSSGRYKMCPSSTCTAAKSIIVNGCRLCRRLLKMCTLKLCTTQHFVYSMYQWCDVLTL